MAYGSIDVVMEAEIGNAVVVRVEGPFRIFTENRPEGVNERFPDVGPVPAGSSRDGDGQADRSRSCHSVLTLQKAVTKRGFPFFTDIGTGDLNGELRGHDMVWLSLADSQGGRSVNFAAEHGCYARRAQPLSEREQIVVQVPAAAYQ